MKLTSTARKALPTSTFAVPSKRKYPINDKNHARNALARVSQFGNSSEKAEVRKKVKSKFLSIGKGTKETYHSNGTIYRKDS